MEGTHVETPLSDEVHAAANASILPQVPGGVEMAIQHVKKVWLLRVPPWVSREDAVGSSTSSSSSTRQA